MKNCIWVRASNVERAPTILISSVLACVLFLSTAIICAQSPSADGFNPGASHSVNTMVVQPDGKVLVGGYFTSLAGQPRNRIGRLHPDGTLDQGFNPGANSTVHTLAVLPNGQILVGGEFTNIVGQTRSRLARLNENGALDVGFSPNPDGIVQAIAPQADGKILVGGYFTTISGQPRASIARLNSDGSLDGSFNPGAGGGAQPIVSAITVQPDGKILVGGQFTTLGGQSRKYIGRLNSDGTLDDAVNPAPNGNVHSITLQSDGKILVTGAFTSLAGQFRSFIGRLHANGDLDGSFNPGANSSWNWLTVQADGRILASGNFTSLGGQSRSRIARLTSGGIPEAGFDPGANNTVSSMVLQSDGKILMGGSFSSLAGQSRMNLGRLSNTEVASQSLEYIGSTITWFRGGTSPEVLRTTFEWSTNGIDWTHLGEGTRISGGWQLTGVSLVGRGTLRVRGFISSNRLTGTSSWFVENSMALPVPIQLSIILSGTNFVLNWHGGQAPYRVQQAMQLGVNNVWENLGDPIFTNSMTVPSGSQQMYLRVIGQ